ncbi:glycosyltransferase family 87 protein [Haloarcula ordinaria]|uniref:glycosyltransferase family 87 protein n=1 Tax=Haloarcula ordinaria TaxID=3033390 RepID=UPI0023E8F628|nr:glycosyltransferase family 87 protein [Halomicroarcula sp. ZS-22-S1]
MSSAIHGTITRIARRRGVIAVALFIFVLVGIYSEYWLAIVANNWPPGHDFSLYYDAYHDAVNGQNPYESPAIGQSFIYHPFALILVAGVALMPSTPALIFWSVGSAAAWAMTVGLSLRIVAPDMDSSRLALSCILSLSFGPFLETIHIGQINTFAALALVVTLFLVLHERPYLAGASLGIAVTMKTSPLLVIGYFLVIRRWRVVTSAIATLAVTTAISMLVFFPSIIVQFVQRLGEIGGIGVHVSVWNQSLPSILGYLDAAIGTSLQATPEFQTGAPLLQKSIVVVPLLAIGIQRLSRGQESRATLVVTFSTFVVGMAIFSPIIWYHHSVFFALPLLLLLASDRGIEPLVGIVALAGIQLSRPLEHAMMIIFGNHVGISVLVAQYLLFLYLIRNVEKVSTTAVNSAS